jgi:flagellar basal-body rod protein FlgG
MLDALYISAIGLRSQQDQLDVIAGNLSNINTPAFKRRSADFSSLLDRAPARAEAGSAMSAQPRPNRVALTDLSPGDLKPTGRALDVAIAGAGFFEIELANGETGYARTGSLHVNAEGGLSLASGHPIKVDLRVPAGASNVEIRDDGTVTATLMGDRDATVLGQLELANFANPERLQYRGEGVFTAPEGGAEPVRARPGEEGTGRLLAGNLEGSNVRMVDEMVSLMLMQRVYELNSRVAQVADELMGMTNNLRRG